MLKRLVRTTASTGITAFCLSLTMMGTAFAFGGCVDSPENPTWILTGIGVAAAGVPWLRAKIKHRRNKRGEQDCVCPQPKTTNT